LLQSENGVLAIFVFFDTNFGSQRICMFLPVYVQNTILSILRQNCGIDNENNEDSLSFVINLLNPSSSRNIKTICLFLKEAFEDHPAAVF
jgi:hypothetical protein